MNNSDAVSFSKSVSVVLLAAGKGTRMNNPNLPKVLTEINKQPLLRFVIDSVQKLNPDLICIVVGYLQELVQKKVEDIFPKQNNIRFALQERQLGTGHAVLQAEPYLSQMDGYVIILPGDMPALTADTLSTFVSLSIKNEEDIAVLSADTLNPTGYGRIVRSIDHKFAAIVEEKDANSQEKKITEVNSGVYCVRAKLLFQLLKQIDSNNAQSEYYLTDIIKLGVEAAHKVECHKLALFNEIHGINNSEDLREVEDLLSRNSI